MCGAVGCNPGDSCDAHARKILSLRKMSEWDIYQKIPAHCTTRLTNFARQLQRSIGRWSLLQFSQVLLRGFYPLRLQSQVCKGFVAERGVLAIQLYGARRAPPPFPLLSAA